MNAIRTSLVAVLALTAATNATAQLSYRFNTGEQITYARTTRIGASGVPDTDVITLTCLARDAKGMQLLVSVGVAADLIGRAGGAQDALVLTIDDTGRRTLPDETPARMVALHPLLDILPALPLAARGETDWVTPADPVGRRWRCTQAGRASAGGILTFSFTEDYLPGVADAVGESRRGRFTFSLQAGHVIGVEVETVGADGVVRRRDEINQGARATMPAEWTLRRGDEASRFLRTLSHAERLGHELDTAAADPNTVIQKLDQLWLAFGKEIDEKSGSPFTRIAIARRDAAQRARPTLLGRAAIGARWMNKPATGWTLENADGDLVTSEAVRRGVTIECFWSSDSAATAHAIDSMRALHKQIAPRGAITILCYNMDTDVVRSRRAIRAIGTDLPQYIGGPLAIGEPLPELPVVRVVDRSGIVRGVWAGWRADYDAALKLATDLAGRTP